MIDKLDKDELERLLRYVAENKIIDKINEIIERVNKIEGILKAAKIAEYHNWWK